ncbi:hypothetical protein MTR67_026871 [Solanum verrucosum]|uniref:Uncharacterized protein n=1 Tax=Solanum verrucosum TaxID=315347 RepID=A0AAF0TUW2_SOLVR|nr:hypothetical protein MTR67_026871 [Solanum verrucosum]
MDISRFITHAQQIEEKNIKEKSRESKRARTDNGDFCHSKSSGHGRSKFKQRLFPDVKLEGTGTLAVSIYGSTIRSVDQSTDRQWSPWFHTWSNFPDLPSMPWLLIYDHHLRSVNGPMVRRSPP